MKTTRENTQAEKHTDDTVRIQRLTCWELKALETIYENYWDERVLACESWNDARDEIAIDNLIGTLYHKLRDAAVPTSKDDGDDWPLEDEEKIRQDWIESGGKP